MKVNTLKPGDIILNDDRTFLVLHIENIRNITHIKFLCNQTLEVIHTRSDEERYWDDYEWVVKT